MNGQGFRIEYGEAAVRDLDSLPPKVRSQILGKIERLQRGLHGDIKRLREVEATYRLRMGNYRVLFDIEKGVIVIRRIGDRKNIYD